MIRIKRPQNISSVCLDEGDEGAMAVDADVQAMMSGDGWYTAENVIKIVFELVF